MVTRKEIDRRAKLLKNQQPKGYGLIAMQSPKTQVKQLRKIYKKPTEKGKKNKLKVLKSPYGEGYSVFLKN